MSNLKKKLFFPLLLVILVVGTVAILHSHLKNIKESPAIEPSPWALNSSEVSLAEVNKGFPALGKVQSSSEVRIVPQIGGTILSMGPRPGGKVKKGDLLVLIDTRTLQAEASALEAKLSSAEAAEKHDQNELEREQHLLNEGGSSESAVEQRQTKLQSDIASVQSLKKQLEAVQVKISYGSLSAPIDGQVSKRLAEPGDTVMPGKIVYAITAEQGGRVIIPVPLSTLTQVKVGGKLELSIDKRELIASITRINPSLDALGMGSLEVDLPQRPFNLPDGAPIAARVITASRSGLSVPVRALLPGKNEASRKLFKVLSGNPAHIELVNVQVELCGNLKCVIQGQLQEGDQVITAHQSVLLQLHADDRVETAEQVK